MQTFWSQITQAVGALIPNLIGALIILILGLIVAWIVSAVVRAILRRIKLDDRIARWITGEESKGKPMKVEAVIGKAIFWLVMLFVLIAFFETLGLTIITKPLNWLLNIIFGYIPQLLGSAVLLALAWLTVSAVSFGLTLGAVAVVVALAFGLRGRELAGRELEKWRRSPESDVSRE